MGDAGLNVRWESLYAFLHAHMFCVCDYVSVCVCALISVFTPACMFFFFLHKMCERTFLTVCSLCVHVCMCVSGGSGGVHVQL